MKVLVVDIGGTSVKIIATGQPERRKLPSGPSLTPEEMVAEVLKGAEGWEYDAVAVGYPGPVLEGRPTTEPVNLGRGWKGFNFEKAFGKPTKVVNDAALQALGSYEGGKMLFLGLGTGLGSAMVAGGNVLPMELGHLPYRHATFEDYVGKRGLERFGKKQWRRLVEDVVERLRDALLPEYVILGGGNVKKIKDMPPGARPGDNANAFLGGFRLWGVEPMPKAKREAHRPEE
jgi:polyphosphate glucokinase